MVHSSAAVVSIATAKTQADGTTVFVSGNYSTYAPKNTSGTRTTSYSYIEDGAKTAGIRVENPGGALDTFYVNDIVPVIGTMATVANTGERYISASLVPVGNTGTGITPTTMNTQTAWTDSSAAGKLASITGTVRSVAGDGSWFTIADGYMSGGNEVQTKVYVSGRQFPPNLCAVNDSIKVIGVVGKEYSSGIKTIIWLFNYEKPTGASDEFTFFCVSDVHYGLSTAGDTANQTTIDQMNALPGAAYPVALGGNVQTPRGVIEIGDIADGGTDPQFNTFAADYGINAECRLRYPVFEGLGNHDGRVGDPISLRVKARTAFRRSLTGISTNGMHYSWDWNSVHFVHLNRVGVNVEDVNPAHALEGDQCYALDFLTSDLTANVGASGRPVFVVQHYGFEEFSQTWWTVGERTLLWNALHNYNVIGIAHGHKHTIDKYQWNGTNFGPSLPNSLDIFEDSSGFNQTSVCPGGFYVIRVRNSQLAWAQRWYNPATSQWEWGISGTKTIVTP